MSVPEADTADYSRDEDDDDAVSEPEYDHLCWYPACLQCRWIEEMADFVLAHSLSLRCKLI